MMQERGPNVVQREKKEKAMKQDVTGETVVVILIIFTMATSCKLSAQLVKELTAMKVETCKEFYLIQMNN